MKKKTLLQSSGFVTLFASLVCIAIGLLFGFLVLLLLGGDKAYSDGFKQILLGGFYMMPSGIGKEIVTAAPLIMCGLSVAFAFKTGLFNIGAAGQYTLGAFGGLVFALLLHAPWWVCLLASTVFGAIWGAIPGIFKAYLNVNEVITAIMFNWIGLYGCNTIMYGRGTGAMYNAKQSKTFAVTGQSLIPSKLFGWDMTETFGYKSCTIAIFLAILVAILLYVVINKTTFGYELKACGCNKNAAKYAGIDEKRSMPARLPASARGFITCPARRSGFRATRRRCRLRASTAFRWRCLPRPTPLRQSSRQFSSRTSPPAAAS